MIFQELIYYNNSQYKRNMSAQNLNPYIQTLDRTSQFAITLSQANDRSLKVLEDIKKMRTKIYADHLALRKKIQSNQIQKEQQKKKIEDQQMFNIELVPLLNMELELFAKLNNLSTDLPFFHVNNWRDISVNYSSIEKHSVKNCNNPCFLKEICQFLFCFPCSDCKQKLTKIAYCPNGDQKEMCCFCVFCPILAPILAFLWIWLQLIDKSKNQCCLCCNCKCFESSSCCQCCFTQKGSILKKQLNIYRKYLLLLR